MTDLKTTVETAKDILAWFDTVRNTELSQNEIAYQLCRRAEVFYNLPLTEVFIMDSKVRRMLISVSTTRGSIRDLTPSGEELTLIAASSIIDGLKEIITLSETSFEVIAFDDSIPSANIYGSEGQLEPIVIEDSDIFDVNDTARLLELRDHPFKDELIEFPTEAYLPSVIPGTGDFEGDVYIPFWTFKSKIKRGPGKGRNRIISRTLLQIAAK